MTRTKAFAPDLCITQVEFYFSDSNLPKDKFLKDKVAQNPEGCKPSPLGPCLPFCPCALSRHNTSCLQALGSFPPCHMTVQAVHYRIGTCAVAALLLVSCQNSFGWRTRTSDSSVFPLLQTSSQSTICVYLLFMQSLLADVDLAIIIAFQRMRALLEVSEGALHVCSADSPCRPAQYAVKVAAYCCLHKLCRLAMRSTPGRHQSLYHC